MLLRGLETFGESGLRSGGEVAAGKRIRGRRFACPACGTFEANACVAKGFARVERDQGPGLPVESQLP